MFLPGWAPSCCCCCCCWVRRRACLVTMYRVVVVRSAVGLVRDHDLPGGRFPRLCLFVLGFTPPIVVWFSPLVPEAPREGEGDVYRVSFRATDMSDVGLKTCRGRVEGGRQGKKEEETDTNSLKPKNAPLLGGNGQKSTTRQPDVPPGSLCHRYSEQRRSSLLMQGSVEAGGFPVKKKRKRRT